MFQQGSILLVRAPVIGSPAGDFICRTCRGCATSTGVVLLLALPDSLGWLL